MTRRRRGRLRTLADALARVHPEVDDPRAWILRGDVVVDGIVRTNPATRVRDGASIRLRADRELRGEPKLREALDAFDVAVVARTALDVGAAAGGFTSVLLERGAARVYAVDAGYGQLRGYLRQDPRVVNLEATNLADLDRKLVPDAIDVVTIDVSYLALSDAVPQLERVRLARDSDVIALVKPQFELGRAQPPLSRADLNAAVARASDAFQACGWTIEGVHESPVRGARGSIEFLLHATRAG